MHATQSAEDDGLVASMYPVYLKGVFDTLAELFDRVGLQKNVGKTVGMICCPCREAGNQSETSYGRQMKGEGLT